MRRLRKDLLRFGHVLLITILVSFVLFALFNYRNHCISTNPKNFIKNTIYKRNPKLCRTNWKRLGVEKVDIFSNPTFEEIARRNPHVLQGGLWKPEGCTSIQKVAIIVPYRDRMHHLRLVLSRIHPMMRKQNIEYRVFVAIQAGDDRFNKGKLNNAAFLEALKEDNFDCFVFHDVDLVPENDKNLYLCDDHLRQLSSAIDETRYHVMFYNNAGGVICLKTNTFKNINGYPNSYWGWGNEDDDLGARAIESGLYITRPPEYIGRFKMIRHVKSVRAENGYQAFIGWRGRWKYDGLNSSDTMKYTVISKQEEQLFTNLTIDLGPSEGHRIDPTKDETHESLWWFIRFYFP